jgi:hypothetical protein
LNTTKRPNSPATSLNRTVKPRVAFQVQHITTGDSYPPSSEYEQQLITQHLVNTTNINEHNKEDNFPDDELFLHQESMMKNNLSTNDHQEAIIPVQIGSIPNTQFSRENRIAEARMVLQDSGANICVTSFAILEALPDLKLYKWNTPKQVVFGNGTSAISQYYVDLGPILHHTAVLSCVMNTILAVLPVNERGYNVTFTHQRRCIVTKGINKIELINEQVHPTRNLYYVDIERFINYTEPSQMKKL